MQDSFGSRLHERSKESPKTMKHLNKLFPNKILIQLPQVIISIVTLIWLLLIIFSDLKN
jgi:hypothetical protein